MRLYCDMCEGKEIVNQPGEAQCNCTNCNGKGYTEVLDLAELNAKADCKENVASLNSKDKSREEFMELMRYLFKLYPLFYVLVTFIIGYDDTNKLIYFGFGVVIFILTDILNELKK